MPAKFSKLCSFPAEWETDIKEIALSRYKSLNHFIEIAVKNLMQKEKNETMTHEGESKLDVSRIVQ